MRLFSNPIIYTTSLKIPLIQKKLVERSTSWKIAFKWIFLHSFLWYMIVLQKACGSTFSICSTGKSLSVHCGWWKHEFVKTAFSLYSLRKPHFKNRTVNYYCPQRILRTYLINNTDLFFFGCRSCYPPKFNCELSLKETSWASSAKYRIWGQTQRLIIGFGANHSIIKYPTSYQSRQ